MMDIGLFLGAGASVHYGYPTTKKLKEKLLESDDGTNHSFKYALLGSDHLYDIEYVLDLLIKFNQFLSIPHIYKFFSGMKINLLNNDSISTLSQEACDIRLFIEQSIFNNYKWNDNYHDKVKNMFGTLYNKINNKNLHVFTTNYDRAIEKFCEKNEIECCDGFVPTDWNKSVYKNNFEPKKNNYLKLYKLHGSLNWRKDDNGIKCIDADQKGDDNGNNFLIYPTLSPKEEEQNYPYNDYINEFKKFTSKNNICIVIGFSFRDFQKEFLKLLKNNGHLIIVSRNGYNNFLNNCKPNEDYSLYIRKSNGFELINRDTGKGTTKFTCMPNSVYIYPEHLSPKNVGEISQEISYLTDKIIRECNINEGTGL